MENKGMILVHSLSLESSDPSVAMTNIGDTICFTDLFMRNEEPKLLRYLYCVLERIDGQDASIIYDYTGRSLHTLRIRPSIRTHRKNLWVWVTDRYNLNFQALTKIASQGTPFCVLHGDEIEKGYDREISPPELLSLAALHSIEQRTGDKGFWEPWMNRFFQGRMKAWDKTRSSTLTSQQIQQVFSQRMGKAGNPTKTSSKPTGNPNSQF